MQKKALLALLMAAVMLLSGCALVVTDVEKDNARIVLDVNVLKETLTVRIHKGDSSEIKTFALEEVKWQKPAPQQPAAENRGESKKQKRVKTKAQPAAETVSEDAESVENAENTESEAIEEEMKPVDQSSDWLRAVEEALNAAKKLQ